MGFSKGLIVLENNRISFRLHKKDPIILDIPKTISENMEVKNEQELGVLIKTFIDTNKLKNNWIIILSPNIVFEKALYGTGVEKSSSPLDEFLAKIPMEREKIGFKIGQKDSKIFAWATSSNYLQSVYISLKSAGLSINAIVPAPALNSNEPTNNEIQKYNFLDNISKSNWSLTDFLKNLYSNIV